MEIHVTKNGEGAGFAPKEVLIGLQGLTGSEGPWRLTNKFRGPP